MKKVSIIILLLIVISFLPVINNNQSILVTAQEERGNTGGGNETVNTNQSSGVQPPNENQPQATPPSIANNFTSPSIYSNTIHFQPGEEFVGLCYPWLVFKHNFLDLSSWTYTPGIGGDTAVSVSCGDQKDYFIVRGMQGVYVISRVSGQIEEAIPLTTMRYIGFSHGELAFSSSNMTRIMVHTPFQGDIYIHVDAVNMSIITQAFGVYHGVPFVVSIASDGKQTRLLYSIQTKTVVVAQLSNLSNAVYVYNNYIIVENDGIDVYEIREPSIPDIVRLDQYRVYVPVNIHKFLKGDLNELYLSTEDGSLVNVSIIDRTWDFLGQATLTPVGIYVPNGFDIRRSTTYVPYKGVVYPIPGMAVARIGPLVFTNVILGVTENGTLIVVPVIWGTTRTTLIAKEQIDGTLQLTGDDGKVRTVRLTLPPGIYVLPRNSTIVTNLGAIKLDRPEAYYPPEMQTTPVLATSLIKYKVADFPKTFQVIDTLKNVKYVTSGGGKLLVIQTDKAIVYSEYGVETVIPGVWKFGGISNYVVLYDGATFRVFDLAGNPVTAYSAFVVNKPIYTTVVKTRTGFDIHVFLLSQHVVINKTGVYNVKDYPAPRKQDVISGVQVTLYTYPEVKYGKFTYHIPQASNVEVNMYKVAWTINNQWFILDIANGTVYVLMNAPNGKIYPLGNYLAYYNNNTLSIIPLKSWIVSSCYVNINAPDFANIYIDGKLVGKGSLKYFADCGKSLNITATAQYYNPDVKIVKVKSGGVTVNLNPKPRISLVTLHVITPKNLPVNSITAEIDKQTVVWYNNDVLKLIAGKPYNITVTGFQPYDVCQHPTLKNVVFQEGTDSLSIPCKITGSILGMKSNVTSLVTIIDATTNQTVNAIQIPGNNTVYMRVNTGTYIIVSKPLESGYVTRTVNVTVPDKQVVLIDITPYPYSKLIISAIPEIANIQVLNMNGTVIGQGVGNLTVKLTPGAYQITADAPGYQQYVNVINITAGESKILNITLTPIQNQPVKKHKPIWLRTQFQILTLVVVIGAVAFAIWYRKRKEAEQLVGGEELPIEESEGGGE